MNFKISDVAGIRLFYREAGHPSKPTIVLLHGFPSSSYQFQDLIPRLADRFHVIAPDGPHNPRTGEQLYQAMRAVASSIRPSMQATGATTSAE
jgi:pimeloyl-ACP methyl ester carboxylesterase